MKVKRLKRKAKHREVAVLLDQETILLEDGTEWPYDLTPDDTKIYAPFKLIKEIFLKRNGMKVGEALYFDAQIRKWRMRKPARYKSSAVWAGDPLEVNVSRSKSYPENPHEAVKAYAEWRDWVEYHGGHINGSISSTSASLFKTTLEDEFITPMKGIEGITYPIGGRLLPCKSLYTTFQGEFIQWDLFSAYSRKLAGLQFGGKGSRWAEIKRTDHLDILVGKGWLIYIEAEVTIPEVQLGPLPIRRSKSYRHRPLYHYSFPRNTTLKGTWTYEEIREADRVGCKIKIIRIFRHYATGKKYWHKEWYDIILHGRETLHGFARSLAKQTGNSLWGRYAMQSHPSKTVWRENGKRVSEKRHMGFSKSNQCMELADQLCGKVRANLYGLAISAGNYLIQGNTDGAWIEYQERWLPPNDDWRDKKRANRIDVLDDATYRYWEPGENEPTYVTPGLDAEYSERIFERAWQRKYAEA